MWPNPQFPLEIVSNLLNNTTAGNHNSWEMLLADKWSLSNESFTIPMAIKTPRKVLILSLSTTFFFLLSLFWVYHYLTLCLYKNLGYYFVYRKIMRWNFSLVARCWLLFACCSLLFPRCLLLFLVGPYFFFVAHYFLLVARYFLIVVRHFLLVARYFLLVAPQEILKDFFELK